MPDCRRGNGRRRFLMAAMGALASRALGSSAAGSARVGYLIPYTRRAHEAGIGAFVAAMRALGHEEGKTYSVEFRSPEGRIERLAALAAELVALEPDVLVTGGTRAAFALKRATATIPIVAISVGDAVAAGLVKSLARPDANLTGTTFFIQDLYAKRFELLREALPRLERIAVLLDPSNPVIFTNLRKMEAAAAASGVAPVRFEARQGEALPAAFATMAAQRCGAVLVSQSPMITANVQAIGQLAMKHRLPAFGSVFLAEAGGVIGYGPDPNALAYRAGYFVDRILKGAKPGDLPMEQPTRFELAVNLKAAKALGLAMPQSVLVAANRVIE